MQKYYILGIRVKFQSKEKIITSKNRGYLSVNQCELTPIFFLDNAFSTHTPGRGGYRGGATGQVPPLGSLERKNLREQTLEKVR